MERGLNRAARLAAGLLLACMLFVVTACGDLPLIAIIRELKNPSVPQFTSTVGPAGASIYVSIVSGATVYAGCGGGGVYKSTNNGTTWSTVGPFLSHDVRALATDGTYLYAGIGDGGSSPYDGAYRIRLSGGSWESFGLSETVWSLTISGGNLYAGTNSAGVQVTSLGSVGWTSSGSGLPSGERVYCLALDGSSNLYAGASDGVYKLSTGAWALVGTAIGSWVSDMICDTSTGYLYVTGDFTGVQYWNNTTWAAYGSGLAGGREPALTKSGSYIYVADNNNGVWRSSGGAWSRFGSGSDDLTSAYVYSLAAVSATIVAGPAVGPGAYTLYTSNPGNPWTKSGAGIFSSLVYDLATDGTNLFAATERGVYTRPLSGGFWSDFGTGGSTKTIYDLVIESGYLYAAGTYATTTIQLNRIPLSGGSWAAFNSGLGTNSVRSLHSDGTYLYAGTWTGEVYQSPKGSASWTLWQVGTESENGAYEFFQANNTLIKASNGGAFYKSLGGGSWARLGTATYGFRSFAGDGTYLYAGTSNNGVQRILLSGLGDWETVGSGLPTGPVHALHIVGGDLAAGPEGGNVYTVPLSGGTWQSYGTGLFDGSTVGTFLTSGQTLNVGTGEFGIGGCGVWQMDLGSP
jgi:hypothetical protein